MLTISPALSASQAIAYHREEFANGRSNYYTEDERILGEWHGRLAEQLCLRGEVREEQFARLAEGLHPETGGQLVQHKSAYEYINSRGEKVHTVEHRAGFDMCFSAPKSISLTALVGGDDRVRQAHRESVHVALEELEQYTQARIGGNFPAETTGAWIVAKFEHDTARPVDGYAAPQLHTHCVIFNITRTEDGKTRALQPLEIFRSQQYATAIYRSELASRLQRMGFVLDQGKYGQPEIRGYTSEYLEASSPRRVQIMTLLDQEGFSGAAAAQIAAYQTRDSKQPLSREHVLVQHRELATVHGNQPEQVIAAAEVRASLQLSPEQVNRRAESAITYAECRVFERAAVSDERALLADALNHSQGAARLPIIREAFESRISKGELIEVSAPGHQPVREFTTHDMQADERRNIEIMQAGRNQCSALVGENSCQLAATRRKHLSATQSAAVQMVLTSRDRFIALEGRAGTGKTTSLSAIREAAILDGYHVQGLAPTSRAAHILAEGGMSTETLQMHLTRGRQQDSPDKRLYIIDESSLTGTRQMREFMERIQQSDRVIFVGDTRQHEAVEAGRPYAQLQEAGIKTARLDEILRQKDPGLKAVVEDLASGRVLDGLVKMQEQRRIHEIVGRQQRIEAITAAYLEKPDGTLVVSPDNRSRSDLNASIHAALQTAGEVSHDERKMSMLVARQDMTAVDRQMAGRYAEHEIIRYTRGSEKLGIGPGEYARITAIDREKNLLTVERSQGESLTYDPRRLSGVQVYESVERRFAENDRIQVTAPSREMAIANRDMGNIERLNDDGTMCLRMDDRRLIEFDPEKHPHLDFGYAVTSYSSQGQTAERVLINIDTAAARGKLLNSRFAYVAVSRAQLDARIYTNDAESLSYSLARDVSQRSAITLDPATGIEIGKENAKSPEELNISPSADLSLTAQDQALGHAAEMTLDIG